MTPQTFIFIGPSGGGKGTQSEILQRELADRGFDKVRYLEAGASFRRFVSNDNYSSKLSKQLMSDGKRQPDFLAVLMWAQVLTTELSGGESLIFDGSPRSLDEAKMIDTALNFYGFAKPTVFYLKISHDEAIKRLLLRGRSDDKTVEDIRKRLDWFERDVLPAIEYYKNNQNYNFIEINGEQDIETVAKDIAANLE